MKKIYYISILASLMASQSNFAATDQTDQEEKFLFTFTLEKKQINDIQTELIFKNCLFVSNKIKESDIEIGQYEELHYSEKKADEDGKYHFRGEIKISDENKIFGATHGFNDAHPDTILKKNEIIPFIDSLLENETKTLLRSKSLNEIYKKKDVIEEIKKHSVKIISKDDKGALTEDFDTFKKRNTPTQSPLNKESNDSNTTNPSTQNSLNQETNKLNTSSSSAPLNKTNTSTESLWSGYQKPFLAIITLAALLGILYYMEVFSTFSSNGKKQNKPSEKSSSSAQA